MSLGAGDWFPLWRGKIHSLVGWNRFEASDDEVCDALPQTRIPTSKEAALTGAATAPHSATEVGG